MALKLNISANIKGALDKLTVLRERAKKTFQGAQLGAGSPLLTATAWGVALTGAYKLASAVTSTVTRFRDMRKEAKALGVSVPEYSQLTDASEIAGVELSLMTSVLNKLNDAQLKASLGSDEAKTQLAAFGLTADKVAKMTAEQKIEAVNDALRAMPDAAQKAALSMAMFGKLPSELDAATKALKEMPGAMKTINGEISALADGAGEYAREAGRFGKGFLTIWSAILTGRVGEVFEAKRRDELTSKMETELANRRAIVPKKDQADAAKALAEGFAAGSGGKTELEKNLFAVDEMRKMGALGSGRVSAGAMTETDRAIIEISKTMPDLGRFLRESRDSLIRQFPKE